MSSPLSQMTTPRPGVLITVEGIDGAGKSSQIVRLAEFLRGRGVALCLTREPGGTPLGEQLRQLLLHQAMHLDTEALLMFAARREHLADLIEPALAAGQWVLSDRFTDASFAYQGGGRGLSLARLAVLERWVQGERQPDITFLFDLPIELARQRRVSAMGQADRFEVLDEAFYQRVREAYLERARQFAERFVVVDASQDPDTIEVQIRQALLTHRRPLPWPDPS